MIDPAIFERLQEKIDQEANVRDVSFAHEMQPNMVCSRSTDIITVGHSGHFADSREARLIILVHVPDEWYHDTF